MKPGQQAYRIVAAAKNPADRTLFVKLLTPLGFDVREAVHGQEAIEIWRTWNPHLIWMDIRLPVMDGYEAAQEIRRAEKWTSNTPHSPIEGGLKGGVPIIAMTASSLEEDRESALSKGCDGFLRKPFRETEVLTLLEQHLCVECAYEEDTQAIQKVCEST